MEESFTQDIALGMGLCTLITIVMSVVALAVWGFRVRRRHGGRPAVLPWIAPLGLLAGIIIFASVFLVVDRPDSGSPEDDAAFGIFLILASLFSVGVGILVGFGSNLWLQLKAPKR